MSGFSCCKNTFMAMLCHALPTTLISVISQAFWLTYHVYAFKSKSFSQQSPMHMPGGFLERSSLRGSNKTLNPNCLPLARMQRGVKLSGTR